MNASNRLDPERIPLVAVESMNQTHREEVALVNALSKLLEQAEDADRKAIDQALAQWLEHTRAHFERENRLMERHGFPAYPIHAQEHAMVLAELERLQSRWQDNGELEPLRDFVCKHWPDWFNRHVSSMDTVTAQFLAHFID
jgi:hemerythrin